MKLQGKVAVVTGAGSGIGRASAIMFAKEGAEVIVADIRTDPGEETVRLINGAGGQAHFVLTDVAKEQQVKSLVDETISRWGRINILFNNAGFSMVKLLDETSEAEWDHLFGVNLKSMFFGVKHVVPHMRRQGGGVILNMGSISGLVGQLRTPAYVASKGAVVLLTKSLAVDYCCDHIRVNCLCPGITDTPALRAHIEAGGDPAVLFRERLARVPLGRFLTPEDVARAALYLVSDDSEGVTGIAHLVDGGLLAVAEYSSAWIQKQPE
ncbi:MAG: SDR family oxidoreductase [Terriglobia bacterium]|jgi:NAD(P)-dependent dehydrogenase (short-subunit alcohol dehydrogenase family)